MNKMHALPRLITSAAFACASIAIAHADDESEKSPSTTPKPDEQIVKLEKFVTSEKSADPNFILPNNPTDAMGFMKKAVESPRSVNVVSSEMISNLSLSNVQDLTLIAPNTFSTSRWGVQGNIDIRAQVADIYFRGMKRIDPQGNSRTALGANDQIEVVKGPPPPYFGAGRVGGYTNMTPKSGRSRVGAYLEKTEGFIQLVAGDFGRRELSFGYGGPMSLLRNKKGGFYIYGVVDDSDTYFQHVPGRQRILQGAISQEVFKNWRVESGINYQETISAGASTIRLTQDLISNHYVWGGRPLVVLDTDGSGKISRKEMEINSPTVLSSTLSSNNGPLSQKFDSRITNAATANLASPRANSALAALIAMRPDFVAKITDQKTLNMLNAIPKGLVMDPDTMKRVPMDFSAVALEKELRAKIGLVYLDFIRDFDPDLTMKNQFFVDTIDQFKDSELPYYQKLDQYAIEDKFTVQKRFTHLPAWVELNTISSVNVRNSRSGGMTGGGDYDDRVDPTLPYNQRTAFDLFVSPKENSTFEYGLPFTSDSDVVFTESGIGSMADLALWGKMGLMLGARYDYVQVDGINHGGTFSTSKGTNGSSAGRYTTADTTYEGNDDAVSWSASVNYKLPYGIIPYFTYAKQAVLLDGGNVSNVASAAVASKAVYEDSTLKEVGIKGSMFKDKFYWAVAAYKQGKTSASYDTTGAEITSGSVDASTTKGIELELRWVPNKHFYVTTYGVSQRGDTVVLSGTKSVRLAGSQLGFADVKDSSGNIIYPAEAFTWGGQNSIDYNVGSKLKTPGYPPIQVGGSANYTFESGFSLGTSMNYNAHVNSGWAQKLRLPAYVLWNYSIGYKKNGWTFKIDLMNAFDKIYFKSRIGGGPGDALLSAGIPRRFQYTMTRTF